MASTRTKKQIEKAKISPGFARIGVIGAGIAGLSAACHLMDRGFRDVTLLEASNRIGGRIHTLFMSNEGDCTELPAPPTSETKGGVVELGANFIDGDSLTNSFLVLAIQNGLFPGSFHYHDRYKLVARYTYTSDGRALDGNFSSKTWQMFEEWLEELDEPNKDVPCSVSTSYGLEEYLRQKLNNSLKNCPYHQRDDVRAIFNSFLNWYKVDQGVSDLGVLPIEEGYMKQAGNLIVMKDEGMGSVAHALSKKLPEGVIKFNQEVTRITWRGSDVTVLTKEDQMFHFDHLIVTFPLGVLKSNHGSLFEPNLPQEKVTAMNKIPVGILGKIVLYWKKPFWKAGCGNMNLAWMDSFFEGNPDSTQWWTQVEGFTEVPSNSHVLIAWLSGDTMLQAEKLSTDDVIDGMTKVLRLFLGNQSIPRPDLAIRTDWGTNPLFQGSYSYWNKETQAEDMLKLAEPLRSFGSPRVLFAGEATNPKGYGYVHGARDSGLRESQRIISFYDSMVASHL